MREQSVNTWILLASTVANSSAFCIEKGLTATDLLTMHFIGVPVPVAVLQNYAILSAFDIHVHHCFIQAGNGCTLSNITNFIGSGLSPSLTPQILL